GGQVTESSHQEAYFTTAALNQQSLEEQLPTTEELTPTPVPIPARPVEARPVPPPPAADRRLEGNLRNIKMPKLLAHIAENRLTGRLALHGGMGAAELFFFHGAPQHASTLDNKGEVALFEIVTWEEGDFAFHNKEETGQRTVTRSVQSILAEA